MKKFKLEISTPCHEDLDKMQTNPQGFYCSSCAKSVIDLSKKNDYEISKFVSKLTDTTNICARLSSTQINHEFELQTPENKSNFKYAAAIAASVLLTTSVVGQEKVAVKTEQVVNQPRVLINGKIARTPIKNQEIISFTLKGKLINATTNKPFSEKLYPNLTVHISGQHNKIAKINPKTGEFTIDALTSKDRKNIELNFSSDGKHFSKSIPFDVKKIKNKTIKQIIKVEPKEFFQITEEGGMGIIFYDDNKIIG